MFVLSFWNEMIINWRSCCIYPIEVGRRMASRRVPVEVVVSSDELYAGPRYRHLFLQI